MQPTSKHHTCKRCVSLCCTHHYGSLPDRPEQGRVGEIKCNPPPATLHRNGGFRSAAPTLRLTTRSTLSLSKRRSWFDRPVLSGAEGLTTNAAVVCVLPAGQRSAHSIARSPDIQLGYRDCREDPRASCVRGRKRGISCRCWPCGTAGRSSIPGTSAPEASPPPARRRGRP